MTAERWRESAARGGEGGGERSPRGPAVNEWHCFVSVETFYSVC